jgi:hypothetical protein
MPGSFPSSSDNSVDLWRGIAWNFYNYALFHGATGLTPPNYNDSEESLARKVAYYTAAAADNNP